MTVDRPDNLGRAIEAPGTSNSAADVLRRTSDAALLAPRPKPPRGLILGSEPIADRIDELLDGFGR